MSHPPGLKWVTVMPSWTVAASKSLWGLVLNVFQWCVKTFLGPRFVKIAAEFCVEVAVLWFVFPLLDTLVEFDKPKMNLVYASLGITTIFLVMAGILSKMGGEEE